MAYATRDELRALSRMGTIVDYPDELLDKGLAEAEALIDSYCGTFEPKQRTFLISLSGGGGKAPGVYGVVSLVSLKTCAGVALSTAGVTVSPTGEITGVQTEESMIEVTLVEHTNRGNMPPDVKGAVLALAKQRVLDSQSSMAGGVLSYVSSEMGSVTLAQAGGLGRPTSIPEVNAVLNRYAARSRWV